MDSKRLQEIKERCEAATPGPWMHDDWCNIYTIDGGHGTPWDLFETCGSADEDGPNAEFIAHAREDIPALLAEIERLRAALEIYADKSNWVVDTDEFGYDGGDKPQTVFCPDNHGEIYTEYGGIVAAEALK